MPAADVRVQSIIIHLGFRQDALYCYLTDLHLLKKKSEEIKKDIDADVEEGKKNL